MVWTPRATLRGPQGAPGGGGSGSGSRSIDGPLARFYAALAARNMQAAVVVFLGSSSTQGQGASVAARSYVALVTAALQAAHPVASGSEPAIRTDLSLAPPASGVQIYNGGVGGQETTNYLDETRLGRIVALAPALISHIIGTNDSFGRRPELVKANIAYWLDRFSAAAPATRHILGLPFERMDKRPAGHEHQWSTYGTVQAELAAERDGVIFVDMTPPFIAAGVPGADPLNLVGTDNLHPTDGGHQLLADTWLAAIRPEGAASSRTVLTPLTLTAAPSLSGTAEVGQTLTLAGDTWSETPDSRLYQWRRGGVVISGATASSYTLVQADQGARVDGQVIAIRAGRASAQTWRSVTVGGATADTTAPVISSFTATPGDAQVALSWAGSDAVGVTQWTLTRGGTQIYQGTATTFTDTGLTNGTVYSYSLVARDAAGNVSTASTASATPVAATTPTPPPASTGEGTVWGSDGFSGDGDMHNRAFDSAGGGSPQTWRVPYGTLNALITSGGAGRRGTANSGVNVFAAALAPTDLSISFRLVTVPEGDAAFLILRRVNPDGSSAFLRLSMKPGGGGVLEAFSGTAWQYGQDLPNGTFVSGQTVRLRLIGADVKLFLDAATTPIRTMTLNGVTAQGYAGVGRTQNCSAFAFDDLVIRDLTGVTP